MVKTLCPFCKTYYGEHKLSDCHKAVKDKIAALEAALESLRITAHYECDDCWYSCPKSEHGCCDEREGDECTCGADKQNAIIDAALGKLPAPPETDV